MRTTILLCGLFLLLAPGCGSVPTRTERYVNVARFPAKDPEHVQVLEELPRRPYDRLGEVFVNPSGDPGRERIEKGIREAAAAIGADAAVVVADPTSTFEPVAMPNRAPAPLPGLKYNLVAVAIRYR